MVAAEEEEKIDFKSRSDDGLLLQYEGCRPEGSQHSRLDGVTQVKPFLLENLLLAF
jgi:hypothetical protein